MRMGFDGVFLVGKSGDHDGRCWWRASLDFHAHFQTGSCQQFYIGGRLDEIFFGVCRASPIFGALFAVCTRGVAHKIWEQTAKMLIRHQLRVLLVRS
jgi:hypothetical protein